MADVILNIYYVNIKSFCDKKYIFISIIVMFVFTFAIRVVKKIICLISYKMELNFDGYDSLDDCQ